MILMVSPTSKVVTSSSRTGKKALGKMRKVLSLEDPSHDSCEYHD